MLDTYVDAEFFERHKKKIRAAIFEFDLNRAIDNMVNAGQHSREDIQKRIGSQFGQDVAKASMMYVDYLILEKDIRNEVHKLADAGDLTKNALRKRIVRNIKTRRDITHHLWMKLRIL